MVDDNLSLCMGDSKLGEKNLKGGRGVFFHAETGRRIRNLSTLWEMGSEIWLSRLNEGV